MKNNGKSVFVLIMVLFIAMLLVSGSTFAYLQWQSSANTMVNVTVASDDITMTIAPTMPNDSNLYPVTDCNSEAIIAGSALVTIVNGSGVKAIPSFKLKLKIEDKDGNVITNDDATGNANKYRYYIKYAVAESNGSCSSPLVSGRFSAATETTSGSGWYDSPVLTGVSFNAPAYQTTTHTYKVWAWIDKDYVSLNTGDTISDKLQNATVTVSWSDNSTVSQY